MGRLFLAAVLGGACFAWSSSAFSQAAGFVEVEPRASLLFLNDTRFVEKDGVDDFHPGGGMVLVAGYDPIESPVYAGFEGVVGGSVHGGERGVIPQSQERLGTFSAMVGGRFGVSALGSITWGADFRIGYAAVFYDSTVSHDVATEILLNVGWRKRLGGTEVLTVSGLVGADLYYGDVTMIGPVIGLQLGLLFERR